MGLPIPMMGFNGTRSMTRMIFINPAAAHRYATQESIKDFQVSKHFVRRQLVGYTIFREDIFDWVYEK